MAGILDDDFIDFLDFYEEEEVEQRLPRRYIRDRENPMEFYEENQFYKRYRFSKDTFLNCILPIVHVAEGHNRRGLPIPVLLQTLVALRFYATGDFQIVLGDLRGISQGTVSRIIQTISEALARNIRQYVKFPTEEGEVQHYKGQFYQLGHFPGIIGVMDCTHIPIKSPGGQFAELYRNRKGWMSLNVQLICGPNLEILNVVSRWPGSTHDSRIFHNSAVKQIFETRRIQGILIGDSGYPQLPYLFTPVLEHHIRTAAERRYNSAHKRTRNIIERVNGILKQRFQCLRRKLQTKMRTTQAVIVACIILHNIGVRRQEIPDEVEDDHVVPVANVVHNHPRGNIIRQQFIQRHFQ